MGDLEDIPVGIFPNAVFQGLGGLPVPYPNAWAQGAPIVRPYDFVLGWKIFPANMAPVRCNSGVHIKNEALSEIRHGCTPEAWHRRWRVSL